MCTRISDIGGVNSFVKTVLTLYFGSGNIKEGTSPGEALGEYYRIEPDEYDGMLYPCGSLSGVADLMVGCGSVETGGQADSADDFDVYAVYSLEKRLCFVSIVQNGNPRFTACAFACVAEA